MAYSQIVKVGDGVTIQFSLNFALGYLKQSDVTCQVGGEVDGSGNPVYRTLTWIDESLVQVGGAVAGIGVLLVFTRTVDLTVLQHTYENGAAIIEENLDESFEQALMAVQQIADGRFGTYQQDLDMGNFHIKNLADGADPQDAVTKSQLDAIVTGSGNVPGPVTGDIGKFLKATSAGVFGWAALVWADISTLITTNIATIATALLTPLTTGTNKTTMQAGLEVVGQHMAPVPAGGINTSTTNGANPSVFETTTNKVNYRALVFPDGATITSGWFQLPMPSSWNEGTLKVRAVWTSASGTIGQTIIMGFSALCCTDGDSIDAAPGTRVTVTDAYQGVGIKHTTPLSAAITPAGTISAGDILFVKVDRDPTNVGDNFAGDVRLISLELLLTTDQGVDV